MSKGIKLDYSIGNVFGIWKIIESREDAFLCECITCGNQTHFMYRGLVNAKRTRQNTCNNCVIKGKKKHIYQPGEIVNNFTIIKKLNKVLEKGVKKEKHNTYLAECKCGKTTRLNDGRISQIKTDNQHHCKWCLVQDRINSYVGKQFGCFTVVKLSNKVLPRGESLFECECECGHVSHKCQFRLRTFKENDTKWCRNCQWKKRLGQIINGYKIIKLDHSLFYERRGRAPSSQRFFEAHCKCGKVVINRISALENRNICKCGGHDV